MKPRARRTMVWTAVAVGVAVAVGLTRALTDARGGVADSPPATAGAGNAQAAPISVKVVHPKRAGAGFARTVTQPAFVQGFYQADLMARVAGVVKSVAKNIGDPVSKGEVLVEIDVPDLEQDLAQKEALVRQAQQDARAAEANVAVTTAAEKAARALVGEREADVERREAKCKFHDAEYDRFKVLEGRQAVVAGILDEKLREVEEARADCKSARVAVDAAKANLEEFQAKLAAARVDVEVKRARVAVADAERGRAQAMVEFAKIRAPFDGVIVSRRVDPGAFVQNASSGKTTPLLTVVRTDRVTLVMWVPEKDAPLVTKDAEAVIRLDALSDRSLRARVTRLSRWLDPEKSRDMRVEVDLDNPTGALAPGMYGTITLVLKRFDDALVVPAGAVTERGGQTYLALAENGVAHFVPVRVQLEDGTRARVVRVARRPDPAAGQATETAAELTGAEEVIASGQGELSDGQPVRATPSDW